ncbi:vascular endothelial growth factor B [Hyperolius riggenbachi]|uniref:vascular endothelial growth factor B n=1 Tax=Hyperolius riggenbachi TaxID=752182 RepID=UPI0035A2ABD9
MDCVLVSSLMWLSALLLCIVTPISVAQTQQTHKLEGRPWTDIYNRSKCQPRWVLLNLLSEFPQFSEFLFSPSCITVQRCAGCCLDEAQSCFPLQSKNIKMEVLKTKTLPPVLTELSVLQHTECECGPRNIDTVQFKSEKKAKKKRRKGKKGREALKTARPTCSPCKWRRRLNQTNCKCICQKTDEECNHRGLLLNKERCRCEKTRS